MKHDALRNEIQRGIDSGESLAPEKVFEEVRNRITKLASASSAVHASSRERSDQGEP
jgi:hypothetical protein